MKLLLTVGALALCASSVSALTPLEKVKANTVVSPLSSGKNVVKPLDLSTVSEASALTQESTQALSKRGGSGSVETIKLGVLFALWYALNIGYNIYNKKALNAIKLPWIVADVQLLIGALYIIPIWLLRLRKAPKFDKDNLKAVSPIAFFHMLGHIGAVIGLGAGAVSFVHIIKAAEPFFTALFQAVFLKQYMAAPVYAALIPVVAGVGLASLKELNFSWVSFMGAMVSNWAFAGRAIIGKGLMTSIKDENMTAANLYAVLTILAFLMLLPLAAIVEGGKFQSVWDAAMAAGNTKGDIALNSVLSGLFYYLYNEVAFLCLSKVDPVTHAVANTIKRVAIIVVSVIVFSTPLTGMGIAGSAIAIGGVLLYSLAKEFYKNK